MFFKGCAVQEFGSNKARIWHLARFMHPTHGTHEANPLPQLFVIII